MNINSDEKFNPAGRVSMAQSGSLSIFSSREQEYEQRAQLLKRLAFVILCSEIDQYHKYMPEIQGELMTRLGSILLFVVVLWSDMFMAKVLVAHLRNSSVFLVI